MVFQSHIFTVPESMLHTPPDCRICAIIEARAAEREGVSLCTCNAQMVPHRPIKGVCPNTLADAA